MQSLECITINKHGHQEFVDRTLNKEETLRKHFQIKNLCAFWNNDNIQSNIFNLNVESHLEKPPISDKNAPDSSFKTNIDEIKLNIKK